MSGTLAALRQRRPCCWLRRRCRSCGRRCAHCWPMPRRLRQRQPRRRSRKTRSRRRRPRQNRLTANGIRGGGRSVRLCSTVVSATTTWPNSLAWRCRHFAMRSAGASRRPGRCASGLRRGWRANRRWRSPNRPFAPTALAARTPREPNGQPQASQARGCCWEEKPPGSFGPPRRCGRPVVPGRPWCDMHCRAHARGKNLQGKALL